MSKKLLVIIIIILYIVVLIPLCAITPLSAMAFDAPGSESSPLVWALVLTFLSIPLLLLISLILQGLFYWRRKYRQALYAAVLPWIPLAFLIVLFTFSK